MDSEQIPSICSICRNEPSNAISLDCRHIFCYLCIKSVSETTGTCPLCRTLINIEFNFKNHKILGSTRVPSSKSGYYWFYEGYKGWWLYDAETNSDLEDAFNDNKQNISKFIAGHEYLIDLQRMVQKRKHGDDNRERKVLRSQLENVNNISGLSGIRSEDFHEILDIMKSSDISV